ncbi:hypothetical protein POF50_031240 [Streptomyces sp. SL13]|uniref:Uncharacterized protein n=1 Tax=Streptantibioticus silvisoli TaxID=2705255 RepID=A0AA90H580_9ACTN|nr:hypothetical protein [Streptantibioticus silvisoli]
MVIGRPVVRWDKTRSSPFLWGRLERFDEIVPVACRWCGGGDAVRPDGVPAEGPDGRFRPRRRHGAGPGQGYRAGEADRSPPRGADRLRAVVAARFRSHDDARSVTRPVTPTAGAMTRVGAPMAVLTRVPLPTPVRAVLGVRVLTPVPMLTSVPIPPPVPVPVRPEMPVPLLTPVPERALTPVRPGRRARTGSGPHEDVHPVAGSVPVPGGHQWPQKSPCPNSWTTYRRCRPAVRDATPLPRCARSPLRRSRNRTRPAGAIGRRCQTHEARHGLRPAAFGADAVGPDVAGQDTVRQEHRLRETCHRLCTDPVPALSHAVNESVRACGQDDPTLRHRAPIPTGGVGVADSGILADLTRGLRASLGEDTTEPTAALPLLLTIPGITTPATILGRGGRGRGHRAHGRCETVLTGRNPALSPGPNLTRALSGRGWVHLVTGRHDETPDVFPKAIPPAPQHTWPVTGRG